MFACAACNVPVILCRACDRGHRYCEPCRPIAWRASRRRARRTYERSVEGRLGNADRQHEQLYASLKKMGYEAPKGDKHSVLKAGDIGRAVDGNLTEVDPEAAMRLLDTIDLSLADGKPVMLGVDYPGAQTASNTDGVTDHWVVVTNRTYDPKTGEVRYEAMDNASTNHPHRVFTVGEDFALRSASPADAGPNSGIAKLPYTATNARTPERTQ